MISQPNEISSNCGSVHCIHTKFAASNYSLSRWRIWLCGEYGHEVWTIAMCDEQPSGRATLGTSPKYLKTRMVCTSPHSHFCLQKPCQTGTLVKRLLLMLINVGVSPNRLHHPTSGTIRSSRGQFRRFRRLCQDTRQRRASGLVVCWACSTAWR